MYKLITVSSFFRNVVTLPYVILPPNETKNDYKNIKF